VILVASYGQQRAVSTGCLYATSVNNNLVSPCTGSDPKGIARDPDVRRVIHFLGLDSVDIVFEGCAGAPYRTTPASGTATDKFIIRYPSNVRNGHVAPIAHELAHVYQIRQAAGLNGLTARLESRRIELGADFLVGLAFSQALSGVEAAEFQHNMSLLGLFYELDAGAHGTPAQRTAAFRTGVYFKFNEFDSNVRRVSDYFQANLYGPLLFQ